MNITILNGNPGSLNHRFDQYLDLYRVKMHNAGHYVRSFMLRDLRIMDLRPAAPQVENVVSEAVVDDFRYVVNSLEETDLLVIASPLEQGYISVLTKMILDRLTRLLTPGELKQPAWAGDGLTMRKAPLMGLILQREPDTNEQDLLLNKLSGERIAANIHSVLDFCITMESGVTDAVCKTFQSIDYHSYIENTYQDLIAGSTLSGM
jgi:hypothetical protein